METCPVQAQANADERRAEANDAEQLADELADAAAHNATRNVVAAIMMIPTQSRTALSYQIMVSVLRNQMKEAIPERAYAIDAMLDAFTALDTK